MAKEIKILPSLIMCDDGEKKELNKLPEKEREELIKAMVHNIEQTMSEYYSEHIEQWENFIKVMRA